MKAFWLALLGSIAGVILALAAAAFIVNGLIQATARVPSALF